MKVGKLKRLWIWVWYCDTTRMLVMFGLPSLALTVLVGYIFGAGQYLRYVAAISYILLFCWMMIDNNYSHLRLIGMNEYRKKIKQSH